ncbi:MAG: hypothetical protein EOP56_11275 [Sphingobacteriales bacterium]|nr:MAG: hypothetical protein EOP56_11275 [Sphingobacteriales bacterium]
MYYHPNTITRKTYQGPYGKMAVFAASERQLNSSATAAQQQCNATATAAQRQHNSSFTTPYEAIIRPLYNHYPCIENAFSAHIGFSILQSAFAVNHYVILSRWVNKKGCPKAAFPYSIAPLS